MAIKSWRLKTEALAADEAIIIAVKNMGSFVSGPGQPTIDELLAMNNTIREQAEANLVAQNEEVATRNKLTQSEHKRHEAVLQIKSQVIALYGRDSNEIVAIGLKRTIDRKRPSRRKEESSSS